jgi:DNA (cytosine-5)-methyltransferase 1
MFLEKCASMSDFVALVLNKTILSTSEFDLTEIGFRKLNIDALLTFRRYGFTGVQL